jgi:phosphate transport system permease protein
VGPKTSELVLTDAAIPLRASTLRRRATPWERLDVPRRVTLAAAGIVVLLVALLLAFIGWNGIQVFTDAHIPLAQLLSPTWAPGDPGEQTAFGILPFILGTVGVMVVAAILAAPLSIGLAIFMAEVAPRWARSITRPAMEVFVGIPSVVYGWLGITILVPFLRENFSGLGFTVGFSWFAGSLVLALMILPTIASIAYDVFLAISQDLRSASLALGTTRWQTIRHILLPAARTGLLTAIVLGMMRAAGEALAVQMVIGNAPVVPTSLTKPMTTLTSQITLDMGNTVSGQPWNEVLWTMGLILLLLSLGFVVLIRMLARRRVVA